MILELESFEISHRISTGMTGNQTINCINNEAWVICAVEKTAYECREGIIKWTGTTLNAQSNCLMFVRKPEVIVKID